MASAVKMAANVKDSPHQAILRLADKLTELRAEVVRFLKQFALGSLDLLRYVGLLVPG